MKGRILRRRTRARGYTLIELLVVVMLIAILAMLAAPSLVRARSDRLAFTYARTAAEIIHSAHSRAAGRGAAHLIVWSKEYGTRGALFVFEALDGLSSTTKPVGPNPSSSCRGTGQWTYAATWRPGTAPDGNHRAAYVDGLNINATGGGEVVVQENITMLAHVPNSDGTVGTALDAFVLCVTPNGTTYYATGGDVSTAIATMQGTTPFASTVEIDVARHDTSGNVMGLNRRVLITGGAAPRIKSE
jgi:prepilin-type N-terminal cleavage/methylation domain-containing protein